MPLFKMKKIWDYCTYNKPFFLLILILFGVLNYFQLYEDNITDIYLWLILIVSDIIIFGYGVTISRDIINDGVRLPKIMIKDIFVLGSKSFIVFTVYLTIQGFILDFISSPLNFPEFNLEEMLFDFQDTLHLLFSHNPFDALIFVVLGSILFYITVFFMEIAIGMLADTGHMLHSFNILEIKKNIDLIGWRHYAKDYTQIILAMAFFSFLSFITIPIPILEYVWYILITLLIFVTQFWGMGKIYREVKEKKSD